MAKETKGSGVAIGYVRVSTTEQAERGLSIDAQKAALVRLAKDRGLVLSEIFEDVGSGTTLDRLGLQAMLDRIAGNNRRRGADRIAAVLVTKLDRLSRDTYDGIGLAVKLQAAGIALVTLEDGEVDRTDPMAELLHTIRLGVARFEARQTAARTRFALQRKKERNERAGTVPFGFRLVGDGSDRLEPEPQEQRALLILSELRGAGFSLRQVAAELNRLGITTRKGSQWCHEYVHRLCRKAA